MKKDIPLEGLRGLAAISVVFGHIIIGFTPYLGLIRATPLNFAINGAGAVIIFFVLSGYVLTRRYFVTKDINIIARGAVKRWPRLMGPVFVTVVLSWALFATGFYHHEEAGILANSRWMSHFGGAPDYPFDPSLQRALAEGFILTFVRDFAYQFDSSLWTMKIEFIGSLLVFGLALFLTYMSRSTKISKLILSISIIFILHIIEPFYVPFVVGTYLAQTLNKKLVIKRGATVPLLAIALYLIGSSDSYNGVYKIFGYLQFNYIYIVSLGASIIIFILECSPEANKFMSRRLFKILGDLSFPIYLIHILIICSLGANIFIHSRSLVWTALGVILAVFLAAIPLAIFNQWWVARINKLSDRLLAANHHKASADESASSATAPATSIRL